MTSRLSPAVQAKADKWFARIDAAVPLHHITADRLVQLRRYLTDILDSDGLFNSTLGKYAEAIRGAIKTAEHFARAETERGA